VIPVRRILFEVFELAKIFFINFTGWFSLFGVLLFENRKDGPFRLLQKDGTFEEKWISIEPVPWGQISLLAFSTYPIIAIPSLADIMWSVFLKIHSKILNVYIQQNSFHMVFDISYLIVECTYLEYCSFLTD
jgi:hypothetical protein